MKNEKTVVDIDYAEAIVPKSARRGIVTMFMIMLGFTLPVLLVFGRDFFINAWRQLKHGHANMDTLVAVSTGVAFLFSLFNTFFPEFWYAR